MAVQFSVVIPTLNEELFLPHLLDCLARQTYKGFEVIIVDGTSTDETVKKAKVFASQLPHLSVYTSPKRQVGYQRNFGALKAKGEYIVFFDADVIIPVNFLLEVAHEINESHAQLLTTYLTSQDRDLKKRMLTAVANVGLEVSALMGKPTAGGFNIVVMKKLFEKVSGFDTTVVYAEDYDFIQRCFKSGVKLNILRTPRLAASFRRYEHQGYLPALEKFAMSSFAALFRPIRQSHFDYPMGGHVYSSQPESKDAQTPKV